MRPAALVVFVLVIIAPCAAAAQTAAPSRSISRDSAADVTVAFNFMRDSRNESFYGFRVGAAQNLSESLAVVVEGGWGRGSRHIGTSAVRDTRDTDAAILAGVRLRRIDGNVAPFFQGTAGWSGRGDSLLDTHRSSFAFRTDVGVDVALTSRMALRASGGWTFLSASVAYQNQFGATVGLTWSSVKK